MVFVASCFLCRFRFVEAKYTAFSGTCTVTFDPENLGWLMKGIAAEHPIYKTQQSRSHIAAVHLDQQVTWRSTSQTLLYECQPSCGGPLDSNRPSENLLRPSCKHGIRPAPRQARCRSMILVCTTGQDWRVQFTVLGDACMPSRGLSVLTSFLTFAIAAI